MAGASFQSVLPEVPAAANAKVRWGPRGVKKSRSAGPAPTGQSGGILSLGQGKCVVPWPCDSAVELRGSGVERGG